MLNILCKKLSKLFRGEAGNTIVLFAVTASILVLAVGVAVDSSRINLVKINQQNAVDAAADSAENFCKNQPAIKKQSCLQDQADKYYAANVNPTYMGARNTNSTITATSGANAKLQVTANTLLDSSLVRSAGAPVTATITSTAGSGFSNAISPGICSATTKNVCSKGTKTDISTTAPLYKWDCVGTSSIAHCRTYDGKCDNSILEGCSSGQATPASVTSDSTQYYSTWTCLGGGDTTDFTNDTTCRLDRCAASHTDCPGGAADGPGTDCTCDTNGNPVCTTQCSGTCTEIDQTDKKSCAVLYGADYSGTPQKTRHVCTCDGNGVQTCRDDVTPAVCNPACKPNTKETLCPDGTNKITTTCGCATYDAAYNPTDCHTDTSQCKPVCVRHSSDTFTKSCADLGLSTASNYAYGTGSTCTQNYKCDSTYGTNTMVPDGVPVCGPADCTSCGTIPINYWVRPSGATGVTGLNGAIGSGLFGFSSDDVFLGTKKGPVTYPSIINGCTLDPDSGFYLCNQTNAKSVVSCTPKADGSYNCADAAGGTIVNDMGIDCTIGNITQKLMAGDNFIFTLCMNGNGIKDAVGTIDPTLLDGAAYYTTDYESNFSKSYNLYLSTDSIIDAYVSKNSTDKKITSCLASGVDSEIGKAPRNITNTNPATGKVSYAYMLLEHNIISPLKVNIAGGDAKINSDRSIEFSRTSKGGAKSIITTYGSINPDEAWLMIDRDGSGLIKDGIIEGEDFFSDGKDAHKNAYRNLATTFGGLTKKDEQGRNYIELRKLSEGEKQADQVNAGKALGVARPINPSLDLKLLDSNNKVLYASDYFDRIYVDYENVNQTDAKMRNMILERAYVRDLNGQYHYSADQWFTAKNIRKEK